MSFQMYRERARERGVVELMKEIGWVKQFVSIDVMGMGEFAVVRLIRRLTVA